MSSNEGMDVIVCGRRHGKTTKILQWLKQARRVPEYPFWDRILIVPTTNRAQDLRIDLRQEAEAQGIDDSGLYYNLVYSLEEWQRARLGVHWKGQVAVDDVDEILARALGQYTTPVLVAMTGRLLHDRDPRTI